MSEIKTVAARKNYWKETCNNCDNSRSRQTERYSKQAFEREIKIGGELGDSRVLLIVLLAVSASRNGLRATASVVSSWKGKYRTRAAVGGHTVRAGHDVMAAVVLGTNRRATFLTSFIIAAAAVAETATPCRSGVCRERGLSLEPYVSRQVPRRYPPPTHTNTADVSQPQALRVAAAGDKTVTYTSTTIVLYFRYFINYYIVTHSLVVRILRATTTLSRLRQISIVTKPSPKEFLQRS